MSTVTAALDQLCVNVIRGLAIDGVQNANSGHPGLPLGAAPMAYALWSRHLRHNPKNPTWFNRDRFVLSAGHGSMLLYSLLHTAGYDLPIEELKRFRQWGSKTPGHPENGLTPGVEMATGPLGQGVATSVGMAIAERFLAATFNRPGFDIVDHHTYVICSDGDLMEGVAQEACSLAGHLKLGKLILLYDDNQITIDGPTSLAFTDDTEAKFKSLGWHTQRVDGNDIDAIDGCIAQAEAEESRPSIILCRTVIGFGSPNKAGTSKVHGAPLGPDELKLTKKALGLPEEESFYVPAEAAKAMDASELGKAFENQWNALLARYREEYPEVAVAFDQALNGDLGDAYKQALPAFAEPIATRNASLKTINAIAPHLPTLLGGCADLAESVLTHIKDQPVFGPDCPQGRNVAYGIREHAMAAALNGITLHGGCRAFGGTFLIFSDYCKPSLRLAALMHSPTIFVFSHDSIGVGEDGPTHQPIEQIAGIRAIPNFNLMRPADGNETAACWKLALESADAPSAIVLTRQALEVLTPATPADHPAKFGAYVLRPSKSDHLDAIILATGSECGIAFHAAEALEAEGKSVRVVNMPSMFLFERQDEAYRNSVLPKGVPTVSVEAGTSFGWGRYAQAHVSIDHFGASAPGGRLMEEFGFTTANVARAVRELVKG